MTWQESLNELADSITLYWHTPIDRALNLPVSVAKQRFDGKAWETYKKFQEAKFKLYNAIIERLNGVISGCNNICKTVANCIPRF